MSASGTLLLARLDQWLRRERPKFYAAFGEGASVAELERLETAVGPLPSTLRALFAWKGQNRDGLQGNWALTSATCAYLDHKSMTEKSDTGEFNQPSWWLRGWIPFCGDGGGNFLCVDLAGAFGGPKGQVIEFWHDDAERTVRYPSIEAWLEVLVDLLEDGSYIQDTGGCFTAPEESVKNASLRVCPGYPKRHAATEVSPRLPKVRSSEAMPVKTPVAIEKAEKKHT